MPQLHSAVSRVRSQRNNWRASLVGDNIFPLCLFIDPLPISVRAKCTLLGIAMSVTAAPDLIADVQASSISMLPPLYFLLQPIVSGIFLTKFSAMIFTCVMIVYVQVRESSGNAISCSYFGKKLSSLPFFLNR